MDRGRAPVVVGVGQVVQRPVAGAPGPLDAVGLMIAAARCAGEDAAAPALLARVAAVLVPEGSWPGGDAGRAVAAAIGATGARTVLARVGVLQTTPLARAAAAIANGHLDVALVVGGEARHRANAAARLGSPAPEMALGGPADDELAPADEIVTALEIERGLAVPVQSYALQEDALRHHRGETVAAHRERLAAWWARFAAVAATNPVAWQDPAALAAVTAGSVRDPAAPGNRMVSSPYTRRHCSRWDVDQAVAILLGAEEVADAAGVPADRRVFPVAVVESNDMIPVSRRAELHRSPATAVMGERLARLTGVEPAAAGHLDLYSCFPSAVQIQAGELGIALDPVPTVTGGMGFAGGPLNTAALHAMATMVDVLRADPGSTGLVTAVSGMLTKVAASWWSTESPPGGFVAADVSAEARAATATVDVDREHAGPAEVEASTVVHDRDGPALAVVLGRAVGSGRRVVASIADRDLAAAWVEQPPTGTTW